MSKFTVKANTKLDITIFQVFTYSYSQVFQVCSTNDPQISSYNSLRAIQGFLKKKKKMSRLKSGILRLAQRYLIESRNLTFFFGWGELRLAKRNHALSTFAEL